MDCQTARQQWHNELDGARPSVQLALHLSGCAACRTYVEQMSQLTLALSVLRDETESVVSSVESDQRHSAAVVRSPWHRVLFRPGVRAAAMIALIVGIGTMFTRQRESNETVPVEIGSAEPMGMATSRLALRGESRDRFMVVASDTGRDDVQLYWLYPLLQTEEPSLEK